MISMFSKPAEAFPLNADGSPSRQGTPKRLHDIITEKRPTFQKVRTEATSEMVANGMMSEEEAKETEIPESTEDYFARNQHWCEQNAELHRQLVLHCRKEALEVIQNCPAEDGRSCVGCARQAVRRRYHHHPHGITFEHTRHVARIYSSACLRE